MYVRARSLDEQFHSGSTVTAAFEAWLLPLRGRRAWLLPLRECRAT
jgi:hypothetical protein